MTDMFSLEGKVAAVVGGGGVLAGEMALGLAKAGADIAILDFNAQAAEARAAEVKALGRKGIGIAVDATKKSDLQAALDRIIAELGHVEILLNAAGINSGTPFLEITEDEWHRIIDVDLKSVFLACQVFGAHMSQPGKGGSIINISSVSSGPPLSRVFTYSVSKGGVNQITQFLAREWATQGVRVNAIVPGFFPAEQHPHGAVWQSRGTGRRGHLPVQRQSLQFRHRVHPAGGRRLPGNDDLVSAAVADTV
jgi:NAD(P)-dependent dehydrogenase (short-subunit alcohol dehydrogenase family)